MTVRETPFDFTLRPAQDTAQDMLHWGRRTGFAGVTPLREFRDRPAQNDRSQVGFAPLRIISQEEPISTVTIAIPDKLSAELKPYLGSLDDLLHIGLREVKKDQGLALYKKGHVSLWKAARLAGVSLREMTDYAVAQGLRAPTDEETIQEELA